MKTIFLAAAIALLAQVTQANNEFAPFMRSYVEDQVIGWVNDPVVIAAIRAQNARHAGISQTQIDDLDKKWRAEIDATSRPTIDAVLAHPVSEFLRQRVVGSDRVISELFIMDNHGLNVAASDITSDYWQGDEAKFQKSHGAGAGAVFVDDVEFDESTQRYLGQVSMSISDPDTGMLIGAITIGLNPEALF